MSGEYSYQTYLSVIHVTQNPGEKNPGFHTTLSSEIFSTGTPINMVKVKWCFYSMPVKP
jgi:hypothetical protein